MGTGFRAILAAYSWSIAGLSDAEYALSQRRPAEAETRARHALPATGMRLTKLRNYYYEEIESTLHPAAQSQLFELLVKHDPRARFSGLKELFFPDEFEGDAEAAVAKTEGAAAHDDGQTAPLNRALLFETHSEYVIRAALNLVASGAYPPDYFAVNYIYPPTTQPVGEPAAYRIPIAADGMLEREFGPGFFDEAQRQKLELLLHRRAAKAAAAPAANATDSQPEYDFL